MLMKLLRRIQGCSFAVSFVQWTVALARVTRQFLKFRSLSKIQRPIWIPKWSDTRFYLQDSTKQVSFDRHYLYHTAWAVRQLAKHRPSSHVDVSSSLYFAALGSAIVPVRHFDFRIPELDLDGLECAQGDLMHLPFESATVASLSCMHVIEHVGLGRYGDAIDPQGDAKAALELSRILAPGGRLLIVTPVGRPKVCFNAHRIYSFEMIKDLFPTLALQEWALVPDNPSQGLLINPPASLVNAQDYACGCFVFGRNA
jgi:SAM-dependent methyltransferase